VKTDVATLPLFSRKPHKIKAMKPIVDFLSKLDKFGENIQKLPETIKPFVVAEIQKNIDNSDVRNTPITLKLKGNKPPLRNTGHLRASITGKVKERKVIVGTNLKYAPILHFGGEIKPKKAKKLAIPANKKIKKMVDLVGVKGVLQTLEKQGWKIHFRKKSIVGTPPKGKPVVLFIRKKKVKIPERPFMELSDEQVNQLYELAENILLEGL